MSFQTEFEKAYEAKKNEDMDLILSFLDEWEGKADLEHIPYIMKLYVNTALEEIQNESITNTLNKIIEKNPEKGIETIIQNIRVLLIENSEYCIDDIVSMLFDDYAEYACFIGEKLLDVDNEVRQIIIEIINESKKYSFYKEIAEETISVYSKLAKDKEEYEEKMRKAGQRIKEWNKIM